MDPITTEVDMNGLQMLASISTGIIAGLITTVFVVIVQKLYVGAIKPWFEELVYKDAEIEGEWEVSYPDTLDHKEIVTLKRSAHRVTGVVAITGGEDQGKTYEIEGIFKNLLLTLTYSATDRKSLDRGTFSLLLKNNGNSFEGASAYYEDTSGSIMTDKCVWKRKRS